MPYTPSQEFIQAINIAEQAGKLRRVSDKISYASEEARFWCNGGWLEDLVKTRLYGMKSNGMIDDWDSNVDIPDGQKSRGRQLSQSNKNELDAAFTVANRLFLIECKTANLAKRDEFSAAIYKLDSLKKSLGGVLSR